MLSNCQLSIAGCANNYYKQHWLYEMHMFNRKAKESPDFALHVAQFQQKHGLIVDGVLGPKTLHYFLYDKPLIAPVSYCLWIGGKAYPVNFPVVLFTHRWGLSLLDSHGFRLRRSQQIDLCVLHWDECISSHACFQVLLWRGLSAHLLLDADGIVYQTLDLVDACAYHARQFNGRSVGIEINNPVFGPPEAIAKRPQCSERLPHQASVSTHADFTPAQKHVLPDIIRSLTHLLHIPSCLPLDLRGNVSEGLMEPDFQGICGHYHLTTDKVDPGQQLWPILQNALQSP
jgi:hypothetical protein